MELVFRALSDPSRRRLLDVLQRCDGQTVGQLDSALPRVTRFATMKHLRILEAAGLLTTRRVGREKLHYLNPVPIRLIHDRWISKYAEPVVRAMSRIKSSLEQRETEAPTPVRSRTIIETRTSKHEETSTMKKPRHVYEVVIRTTPERLWHALTDPNETQKYFYGSRVESDWKAGDPIRYVMPDGSIAIEGRLLEVVPNRKFSQMWHALWDEQVAAEAPHKVTWEITPMGGACKLSVIHEDLGPQTLEQVAEGLVLIVSGLKTLLETGQPLVLEAAGQATALDRQKERS